MSLGRARKFCGLCHGYDGMIGKGEVESMVQFRSDDYPLYQLRDQATVQAMRALETFRDDENADEGVRLLEECARCDYSSPKIVELTTGKSDGRDEGE